MRKVVRYRSLQDNHEFAFVGAVRTFRDTYYFFLLMRINKISHVFYLTADYTESENDTSAQSENDTSAQSENDTSAQSENDTSAQSENDTSSQSENDTSAQSENDTSAQSRVLKSAALCHESNCWKSECGRIEFNP